MLINNVKQVPEQYHDWINGKAISAWHSKTMDLVLDDVLMQANTHTPVRIRYKDGNEYDISFEDLAALQADYRKRNGEDK